MKKSFFPILLLSASLFASAQTRFDASTQLLLDNYETLLANPDARLISLPDAPVSIEPRSRAEVSLPVFITLAQGASLADLEAVGVDIVDHAGSIVIANASPAALRAVAEQELASLVTLSKKMNPLLDKARASIGMDIAHAGTDLPAQYTGKGVICGIFDTGVDAGHINFYNKDFSASRVRSVFYYTANNGSSRNYGEDGDRDLADFTTDSPSGTHGTHTLGCMAGGLRLTNGVESATRPEIGFRTSTWDLSTNSGTWVTKFKSTPGAKMEFPYYGMAPDADILVSCGQLYSSNYTAGISRMARFAQSQGQPCVINLSFGSLGGIHDCTDQMAQFFDNVIDETGAVLFLAAGNDGDVKCSSVKTFTAADKELKFFLSSTGESALSVNAHDNTPLSITPVIFDKANSTIVKRLITNPEGQTTYSGTYYTSSAYYHDETFNEAFSDRSFVQTNSAQDYQGSGRYCSEILFSISNNSSTNRDGNLVLGFIIAGTENQTVDAALSNTEMTLTSNGLPGWTDGDASMSINSLAGAKNLIVVGAYNTRFKWAPFDQSRNGNWVRYQTDLYPEEIAEYSSYGTLADGRTLPDVCAPGTGICSSYSSYYIENSGTTSSNSLMLAWCRYNSRDYGFAIEQGTSMATPIVAGAVAAWLQADPTLNAVDVKNIIYRTAVNDTDTESTGCRAQWGAGKFSAIGGLKEILKSGVANVALDRSDILVSSEPGSVSVTAPNATSVSARLFNIGGVEVAAVNALAQEATLSTAGLPKGIYILNVNGDFSQRIVVK